MSLFNQFWNNHSIISAVQIDVPRKELNMQSLMTTITDPKELVAFKSKGPISVSPTPPMLAKTYASYRRLQLETALTHKILESAQYAELARSIDASYKQPGRQGGESN